MVCSMRRPDCRSRRSLRAPASGQYSRIALGVYTFNSSDAGKAILANYTYTVSGAGQKFTVANQLLGTTPTFQALFYTTFQGQAISLKLNNCTSNKLSFQTKLEDFVLPEFDFSCFADASGNVMTWSFAEVILRCGPGPRRSGSAPVNGRCGL